MGTKVLGVAGVAKGFEVVGLAGVTRVAKGFEVVGLAGLAGLAITGRMAGSGDLRSVVAGKFISSSDKSAADLTESVVVGDNLIAGADHDWAGERA